MKKLKHLAIIAMACLGMATVMLYYESAETVNAFIESYIGTFATAFLLTFSAFASLYLTVTYDPDKKRKLKGTGQKTHQVCPEREFLEEDIHSQFLQKLRDESLFKDYEYQRLRHERDLLLDRYLDAIEKMEKAKKFKLSPYRHQVTDELNAEYEKYNLLCTKLNVVYLNYHQYMFSQYHPIGQFRRFRMFLPKLPAAYIIHDEETAKYKSSNLIEQLHEEFNKKYGLETNQSQKSKQTKNQKGNL